MQGCAALVMEGGRVSPKRPDSGFQRKRCLMPLHESCCGLWQERCRGSLGQEDSGGDGERPECWRAAMSSWANDSGRGRRVVVVVVAGGGSRDDGESVVRWGDAQRERSLVWAREGRC